MGRTNRFLRGRLHDDRGEPVVQEGREVRVERMVDVEAGCVVAFREGIFRRGGEMVGEQLHAEKPRWTLEQPGESLLCLRRVVDAGNQGDAGDEGAP